MLGNQVPAQNCMKVAHIPRERAADTRGYYLKTSCVMSDLMFTVVRARAAAAGLSGINDPIETDGRRCDCCVNELKCARSVRRRGAKRLPGQKVGRFLDGVSHIRRACACDAELVGRDE